MQGLICTGDFNYIADLSLDRTYKMGHATLLQTNTYTKLHALFEKFHLLHCWRHTLPKEKDFSYYSLRHGTHTQIDFILTSKEHCNKLLDSTIGIQTILDHAWVSGTFRLNDRDPGEKFWMLNKSVLHSELTKAKIGKASKPICWKTTLRTWQIFLSGTP